MVLLKQEEEQHCSLRFHCGTDRESGCPLKVSQFTAIYGCPNRTPRCLGIRRAVAHLLLPCSSKVRRRQVWTACARGSSFPLYSSMRSPEFMHGMGCNGMAWLLARASGKRVSPLTKRGFAHRTSWNLPLCILVEIKHPYTLHLTGSRVRSHSLS